MAASKRARSSSKQRGRGARCFYDGCSNAQNLEQLTTKERVAVASSLGYHATIISKFFTIEELTKKHRYAETHAETHARLGHIGQSLPRKKRPH